MLTGLWLALAVNLLEVVRIKAISAMALCLKIRKKLGAERGGR